MGITWKFDLDMEPPKDVVRNAAPAAVRRAAEFIRGEAVLLAPVLTGHLKQSAEMRQTGPSTCEVSFPGPYARYQHYELQLRHPRGGQALYLEQPMVEKSGDAVELMARTLREAGLDG